MYFCYKILIYFIWCHNEAILIPISTNSTFELYKNQEEYITVDTIRDLAQVTVDSGNNMQNKITANTSRTRVKRQCSSGAGKFVEASKMPQLKLLRLFLQMFKNFWDYAYVGGSHPLHPNVPKAIVALYKQKVVEFFIPDVGEDAQKV